MLPSIPAGSILISSWASSAHSIPLGILGSSHSFLLLTFLWAFTKPFGLPRPNYHILYFWVYWPSNQSPLLIPFFGLLRPIFAYFQLLMILMGLLLHSLALGPFAFFGALLLFCRPVDHYSCHSSLMVFFFPYFANSSFFTFFHIVGLLLLLGPFAKMVVNKDVIVLSKKRLLCV